MIFKGDEKIRQLKSEIETLQARVDCLEYDSRITYELKKSTGSNAASTSQGFLYGCPGGASHQPIYGGGGKSAPIFVKKTSNKDVIIKILEHLGLEIKEIPAIEQKISLVKSKKNVDNTK